MKRRIVSLLLAALLLCGLLPVAAQAQEQELQVEVSQTQSMSFSFSFDKAEPTVFFVAPNGEIYDETALEEGRMSKELGDGYVTYFIPFAQAGTWTICYDKGPNSRLELTYAPFGTAPEIESFTLEKIEKETAHIRFRFSYGGSRNIQYRVSAVIMENGSISGRKELSTGSCRRDSDETARVSLKKLASYQEYYLELEVFTQDGSITVYDRALSEPFSYTAANAAEAPQNIRILAGISQDFVLVDWTDGDNFDELTIAAFLEGESQPIHQGTYKKKEKAVEILANLREETVILEITGHRNGISSETLRYTLVPRGTMTFQEEGSTGSSAIAASYKDFPENTQVYVLLADNAPEHTFYFGKKVNAQSTPVSGMGSLTITIPQNESHVSVYWQEGDVWYLLDATMYADRMPPILELWEHTGTIVTQDQTFVLVGRTEPGCTVQILAGGQVLDTPAVDAQGLFSSTLTLAPGGNLFDVTAMDQAGNKSSQVLQIRRPDENIQGLAPENPEDLQDPNARLWATLLSWRFGIFALVLCLYIIGMAFLLTALYRRSKARKKPALLHLIRNLATALLPVAAALLGWVLYQKLTIQAQVESQEFFQLAQTSLDAAHEKLLLLEQWESRLDLSMKLAIGLAILVAVLWLMPLVLKKLLKKKPKAPTPPAAPVPETPVQAAPEQPEEIPTVAAPRFCTGCGAELAPGSSFCTRCGTPVHKDS